MLIFAAEMTYVHLCLFAFSEGFRIVGKLRTKFNQNESRDMMNEEELGENTD